MRNSLNFAELQPGTIVGYGTKFKLTGVIEDANETHAWAEWADDCRGWLAKDWWETAAVKIISNGRPATNDWDDCLELV